jgi:hypothetical protein
MKNRYLVTLELQTYDEDLKAWDWKTLLGHEYQIRVIETQWKGRVLPADEEGEL